MDRQIDGHQSSQFMNGQSNVEHIVVMKVQEENMKEEKRKRLAMQVSEVDVNIAAAAVALRVKVKIAAMPPILQAQAFRCARRTLDAIPKPSCSRLALALKKEFDGCYGPAWHCIVGRSFGSFVTHSFGGFLYFSVENLSILLFKTTVERVRNENTWK